ncbi:MAG: hypothetical protein M9894_14070 [Planctomycetes bacterium]|nr:hypothetical protein [Planctomycetota bacterium]
MSPVQQPPAPPAPRARQVFELWRDEVGTYSFFPREHGAAREEVGARGELVWSVEAAGWEEAVAAQRRYLGWGG